MIEGPWELNTVGGDSVGDGRRGSVSIADGVASHK